MKAPIGVLALLLALFSFAYAQMTVEEAIGKLPNCAFDCLQAAVEGSKCSMMDPTCMCADHKLEANMEHCVGQACTVKQGLTTKNVTMTMCHRPIRDKTAQFHIPNVALVVIASLCVVLRVAYKLIYTVDTLRLDDYLIVATLLTLYPGTIINELGTMANGHGRDVWTLEFNQVTQFLKYFFVVEMLYFLNVTMLKLALLAFYHYIFPGPKIRKVIWASAVVTVLFGISFIITGIFQCRPIKFYWESWDQEHDGRCINLNALGWAHAAVNIILDIWMLAIPLQQVTHLQLPWKKKIGVALMFGVGTFVTIISIVRLQSLVHFANSKNPTYDQLPISNWSTIEINVGIICACMPAIRVVLVRMFPKVLGNTTHERSQYSKNPTGGHRTKQSKGGLAGDRSVITFTKTFEVREHTASDEVGLVTLDDMRRGSTSQVRSGNASQVSV